MQKWEYKVVYLVVPEQIDFQTTKTLSRQRGREIDFQRLLRPTKNEPKENSREFSQVEAAAYQQCIDLVALLTLQVVSFHPVVLFQVTNHWLDGGAPAQ